MRKVQVLEILPRTVVVPEDSDTYTYRLKAALSTYDEAYLTTAPELCLSTRRVSVWAIANHGCERAYLAASPELYDLLLSRVREDVRLDVEHLQGQFNRERHDLKRSANMEIRRLEVEVLEMSQTLQRVLTQPWYLRVWRALTYKEGNAS